VLEAPGLDTALWIGLHKGGTGRTVISCPAVTPLLIQSVIQLVFWFAGLHAAFLSIRTLKSFSAGLHTLGSPIAYTYLGLPSPKCNILHVALLNLIRFVLTHFSNPYLSLFICIYSFILLFQRLFLLQQVAVHPFQLRSASVLTYCRELPFNHLSLKPTGTIPSFPSPVPSWSHQQIRTKARGNEYQPNNRKRKRTHGWIKRISTPAGIEVILRRMLKGRKSLTH